MILKPDNERTLYIRRTDYSNPNQIIGTAAVGFKSFKTLELPDRGNARNISCIPKGTYKAVKHNSPKFGESIHILNVPNRSEVLVHYGNFYLDTRGCILIGIGLADINGDGIKDVTSSKRAMRELLSLLPDEFDIVIA